MVVPILVDYGNDYSGVATRKLCQGLLSILQFAHTVRQRTYGEIFTAALRVSRADAKQTIAPLTVRQRTDLQRVNAQHATSGMTGVSLSLPYPHAHHDGQLPIRPLKE
jgi:hypothetical protein